MALLPILESNPEAITELSVPQVVALCGNGKLTDNSDCSKEFRTYLKQAENERLFSCAYECLDGSFDKSGLVLQDIVNELGRRLDFDVEDGIYQGKANYINSDGYWKIDDENGFIVEVKTTDSYRINLDKIAKYRFDAIDSGITSTKSSILIVVGRQDTGDLEAQVRGSRHAWDMRIISVDALAKLVKLREETEDDTVSKIRNVLSPIEYTRVDDIIDLAFVAASELSDSPELPIGAPEKATGTIELTPKAELEEARQTGKARVELEKRVKLLKKSRAKYWSADEPHSVRAVLSVSKQYKTGYFWYAYHPKWDDFLSEAKNEGYLVLCCIGREEVYLIPREWISQQLSNLNQTHPENGLSYWHIHLLEGEDSALHLKLHKAGTTVSLKEFWR